jgi:hypothetical protein
VANQIKKHEAEIMAQLEAGQNPRDVANEWGLNWKDLYNYMAYHFNKRLSFKETDKDNYDYREEEAANTQQVKAKHEAAKVQIEQNPYLRAINRKATGT